jgi:hypothetical protein
MSEDPFDRLCSLPSKNAPPLFETLVVLGRDVCLERIKQADTNLQSLN